MAIVQQCPSSSLQTNAGFAHFAPGSTAGPATWRHVIDIAGAQINALSMDIDHVIVGPGLVASGARVLDAGSSDHRPVGVSLARASR